VIGWTVELTASARRQYRMIDDGPQRSAANILAELSEDVPEIAGAIPLRGYRDLWRVRFIMNASA
jgi:hypothetical protein